MTVVRADQCSSVNIHILIEAYRPTTSNIQTEWNHSSLL